MVSRSDHQGLYSEGTFSLLVLAADYYYGARALEVTEHAREDKRMCCMYAL